MDNLRGAILISLAMLGFAIEDMCVKLAAQAMPTWQIVLYLAIGGALIFGVLVQRSGQVLISREMFVWSIHLRNLCEIVSTMGFVTALALSDLSTASAILQSAPLLVTLGAAAFLKEQVGWRRWSAIFVGFLGVLLILKPGTDAFQPASLFAVIGVTAMAARDLLTRQVPSAIGSLQISFLAFLTLAPTALILAMLTTSPYVPPTRDGWLLIAVAVVMGVSAYYAVVAGMRLGDVAVVTPFRYTRMVFALIVGATVFGETPDMFMVLGVSLIVGSGLFTLWRERLLRRTARMH